MYIFTIELLFLRFLIACLCICRLTGHRYHTKACECHVLPRQGVNITRVYDTKACNSHVGPLGKAKSKYKIPGGELYLAP